MDDHNTFQTSSSVRLFWTLIILSGLPLLAYPWVLLANMMSLLGERPWDGVPIAVRLSWYIFLAATTLYPVVFFASGALGWQQAHWGDKKRTAFWSLAPLVYLLLIVGVFSFVDSMSVH